MTRAIRFSRTGGPEVVELEEISLPEPKAGERVADAGAGAPAAYADAKSASASRSRMPAMRTARWKPAAPSAALC